MKHEIVIASFVCPGWRELAFLRVCLTCGEQGSVPAFEHTLNRGIDNTVRVVSNPPAAADGGYDTACEGRQ